MGSYIVMMRKTFLHNWKLSNSGMYDAKVWNEYFVCNDSPFHNDRHTLGLTLNIDWFQPFIFSWCHLCGYYELATTNAI